MSNDTTRARNAVKHSDETITAWLQEGKSATWVHEQGVGYTRIKRIKEQVASARPAPSPTPEPSTLAPRRIDEQKALVTSVRPTTPYQRFIELLADKAEADKALAAFEGERERVLADLEARRQRLQREAAQAKAAVDAHVDMHHAELNAALHVQETIIKKAVQRTVVEQEAATKAAEWRRMELEATREH